LKPFCNNIVILF